MIFFLYICNARKNNWKMNPTFVQYKGGVRVKVPESTQSTDCFYVQRPPVFKNPMIMHVNQTQQWPDNDFERRYWQNIHNLNRKEAPKATPDKTPVGQYVLHLVELINTEEA